MILQLNPPIHVTTPLGEGFALLVIDYGPALNSIWGVHLFDGGHFVHVTSKDLRIMGNPMYSIPNPAPPSMSRP